jgi:ABC-type dipeptide/oligopeptide/nickel transport system permease component
MPGLRVIFQEEKDKMQGYILRRLVYGIPTLIGVSIVIFMAMRVVPGDPVVVAGARSP